MLRWTDLWNDVVKLSAMDWTTGGEGEGKRVGQKNTDTGASRAFNGCQSC